MAENNDAPAGAATNGTGAQPSLNVLAQYVKDLSFESPGAPNSLRGRDKAPGIAINVNVNANPLSDNQFDVNLTLNAKASFDKEVLFNVELVYGGVFRLKNVPEAQLAPLLMVECPRLIFPFARQVVAEAVASAGFPPLLLDPIDFGAAYMAQLQADQGPGGPAAEDEGAENSETADTPTDA